MAWHPRIPIRITLYYMETTERAAKSYHITVKHGWGGQGRGGRHEGPRLTKVTKCFPWGIVILAVRRRDETQSIPCVSEARHTSNREKPL